MATHSRILAWKKNPTGPGAWWATGHGIGKRWIQLSSHEDMVLREGVSSRCKINFWGDAVDDVGSCGRQKRKGRNRKLKRAR